jgi:AcrR family transcriptional regulator
MTAPAEPRRLRADAARNRQALIDAGQRLFVCRGLSVTLDEIAAEAGVNVATAYRHFANKHELFAAFVQQQLEQAVVNAEEAAALPDPWEGLTHFLRRTADLMVANRGLRDLFTPGLADEWLEQVDTRIEPALQALVARGKEAGVLRREIEPGDLGVILQMLTTVGDIPAEDQESFLHRYLALMLAGLRPSDAPLPGPAPSPAQARAASLSSERGGRPRQSAR